MHSPLTAISSPVTNDEASHARSIAEPTISLRFATHRCGFKSASIVRSPGSYVQPRSSVRGEWTRTESHIDLSRGATTPASVVPAASHSNVQLDIEWTFHLSIGHEGLRAAMQVVSLRVHTDLSHVRVHFSARSTFPVFVPAEAKCGTPPPRLMICHCNVTLGTGPAMLRIG